MVIELLPATATHTTRTMPCGTQPWTICWERCDTHCVRTCTAPELFGIPQRQPHATDGHDTVDENRAGLIETSGQKVNQKLKPPPNHQYRNRPDEPGQWSPLQHSKRRRWHKRPTPKEDMQSKPVSRGTTKTQNFRCKDTQGRVERHTRQHTPNKHDISSNERVCQRSCDRTTQSPTTHREGGHAFMFFGVLGVLILLKYIMVHHLDF
jgi:hypothetical protein